MVESDLSRITWDEYFMQMVCVVAGRSTCIRRQVGAVLVRERHILATGYNGAPSRLQHCTYTGCVRQKHGIPSGERHELCRGVHAEQNAIIQAAVHGTAITGSTLYTSVHPCGICAKMIINAGIRTVRFGEEYADKAAANYFSRAGVDVRTVKMPQKDNTADKALVSE